MLVLLIDSLMIKNIKNNFTYYHAHLEFIWTDVAQLLVIPEKNLEPS